MTIRGSMPDILAALDDGHMVVVYSGGLHHIQAPGELVPRPLRQIRARIELVDISSYAAQLGGTQDMDAFRAAVIQDLTDRRDTLCPVRENGGIRGGDLPYWLPQERNAWPSAGVIDILYATRTNPRDALRASPEGQWRASDRFAPEEPALSERRSCAASRRVPVPVPVSSLTSETCRQDACATTGDGRATRGEPSENLREAISGTDRTTGQGHGARRGSGAAARSEIHSRSRASITVAIVLAS
jgi:hypothetical protein